jgi:hypothetical protein
MERSHYKQREGHEGRLSATRDERFTIRGTHHRDEESGKTIVVVQQFAPAQGDDEGLLSFSAFLWPGMIFAGHVASDAWKARFADVWLDLRDEVLTLTGLDLGEALPGRPVPPSRRSEDADPTGDTPSSV